MYQAAWEYSTPVLLDGQAGDGLENINLALEDSRGCYWSQSIDDPGQAANLAYTDPIRYEFVQPRGTGPLLGPTYTASEQYPDTSPLLSRADHADVSGHVLATRTSMPLSPAYIAPEQYLGANVLLGHPNHGDFSVPPIIEHRAHANGLSLSQPQPSRVSLSSGGFLDCTLFDRAIPPQNPAYGECQYPNINQNFDQKSDTMQQSDLRHDENSNHMLSGFEQKLSTNCAPIVATFRPCVRCRLLKKQCHRNTSGKESRCLKCSKQGIPTSICNLAIILDTPFDKCLNTKHSFRYTSIQLNNFSSSKTVQLGHYPKGPTVTIECCQFHATSTIQTTVLRKNRYDYRMMHTPAWCLKVPKINVLPYLQECVGFTTAEACARQHPQLSPFFRLAYVYKDVPILRDCWTEFTGLRLLRLGWDFSGSENLGVEIVRERDSAFYGLKPVPRMLRDQLNHALELEIMELDTKNLKGLRRILENEKPHMWVIGYLVLFFLLHIREVYAGQHLYWSRSYTELADFWNHRSSPAFIIDRVVASCNSILSLFHFSKGSKLLRLDWDDDESRKRVDDSRFVEFMKELQAHARKLKNDGWVGRKACNVYEAGDPNSVDLTVCSLLFESAEEGCVVKDFC